MDIIKIILLLSVPYVQIFLVLLFITLLLPIGFISNIMCFILAVYLVIGVIGLFISIFTSLL